jgi:hypothetical protein
MPASKDIFHRVEIGNLVLAGVAGRGDPYITRLDDKMSGDVQLGPSKIQYFDANPDRSDRVYSGPGYYVVKYDNEIRVGLPGMTEDGARRLAAEFGMRFCYEPHEFNFWDSPAGRGLLTWSQSFPRLAAQRAAVSEYLPSWKDELRVIT